jgi:hypothetical protein
MLLNAHRRKDKTRPTSSSILFGNRRGQNIRKHVFQIRGKEKERWIRSSPHLLRHIVLDHGRQHVGNSTIPEDTIRKRKHRKYQKQGEEMAPHLLLHLVLERGRQHVGEEAQEDGQQELHEGHNHEDRKRHEPEHVRDRARQLLALPPGEALPVGHLEQQSGGHPDVSPQELGPDPVVLRGFFDGDPPAAEGFHPVRAAHGEHGAEGGWDADEGGKRLLQNGPVSVRRRRGGL